MQDSDFFGLVFVLTVAITRLGLWLRPTSSPTIKGFRLHHYMYGLALIPVGLATHIGIYAVGMGLFIDELTYLCTKGKNHADNYSKLSLVGTAVLTTLVVLFRDALTP